MTDDLPSLMRQRIAESRKLLAELTPESDRNPTTPSRPLTVQEEAVARALATGAGIKIIAARTGFSASTVRYHIARIAAILPRAEEDELSDRDRVLVFAHNEYRVALSKTLGRKDEAA